MTTARSKFKSLTSTLASILTSTFALSFCPIAKANTLQPIANAAPEMIVPTTEQTDTMVVRANTQPLNPDTYDTSSVKLRTVGAARSFNYWATFWMLVFS